MGSGRERERDLAAVSLRILFVTIAFSLYMNSVQTTTTAHDQSTLSLAARALALKPVSEIVGELHCLLLMCFCRVITKWLLYSSYNIRGLLLCV